MNISTNYEVSLRIFHPSYEPEDICQTLNMEATHMWAAGDLRGTPHDSFLPGLYAETYCCFELWREDNRDILGFLGHWNSKLWQHRDYLQQINSTGGRVEYFIGWFSKDKPDLHLNSKLMGELDQLQISLAIDYY